MEESTPTIIQEYFGEYGIMGSIIVILLFIIGFMYLRKKYPKMTLMKDILEETPAEEPPRRVLNAGIRYAQPNRHTTKPLSMFSQRKKRTEAVVYGLYWA